MPDSEFTDLGNDLDQVQPPEAMRETRILAAPEGVAVYTPPEDASPNDLLIVKYHDFFQVVRELGGSPLQAFQLYSQKLMGAVVTNGEAVVRSLIQAEAPPPVELPPVEPPFFSVQTEEEFQGWMQSIRNEGIAEGQRQAVALGTAKGSVESLDVGQGAADDVDAETTDVPSDASSSQDQDEPSDQRSGTGKGRRS